MMIKRIMYSVALLMLMGITGARAQVAIGTLEDPNTNAILDLSQVSAKNLGLMLPQVSLANVKVWQLNGGTPVEGMLIYNTNDNLYGQNYPNALGVFVWYDGEWHGLKKNEYGVEYVTDFNISPLSAYFPGTASESQDFSVSNWSPTTPTYQGVVWSIVEGADKVELSNLSLTSVTVSRKSAATDGSALLRATSVDGHVVKEVPVTIGCGTQISGISGTLYWTGYFGVAGCWMTENLAETQYATGVNIVRGGLAINDVTTTNYAAYISTPGTGSGTMTVEDAQNSAYTFPGGGVGKPGLLYSWVAATGGGSDQSEGDIASGSAASSAGRRVQGACPDGWHVPNDYEWNLLEKEIYLHPAAYTTYTSTSDLDESSWLSSYETVTNFRPGVGGSNQTWWGHLMKSSQKVTSTDPKGSSNAATANGFNGLLVGDVSSNWYDYGMYAFFCSSSTRNATYALYRSLYSGYPGVDRSYYSKNNRYSLRCKKN